MRPVTESDYQDLFRWRNSETYQDRFNEASRKAVDFSTFTKEYSQEKQLRKYEYIIELQKSDVQAIGIIFTHTHSSINGYCSVNIFIEHLWEGKGYAVEAFGLLVHHLFDTTSLHKVYVDVFAYNLLSLSTIQSCGLVQEGRFIGHRLHRDERHDVIRFAAYRSTMERFTKILKYMNPR